MMRLAGPDDVVAMMSTVNRQFVSLPSAKDAYGRLFDRLQAPAASPLVYHCTAGKDRTGWATAVLLTLLGVPRETVMADYLLSNDYLVQKNQATLSAMSPELAAKFGPALTVRAAYLQAAFDEVEQRYGSFDRYLKDGLGLDAAAVARLRERFLTGAAQS